MSTVTNPVMEVEHFGNDIASYGDIIFNLSAPDPAVPLNSPRPKATGSEVFSPWGESNDFPQEVIRKVEQDTEIGALLDWKGRLLQGKEVIAIRNVWDEAKKDFQKERINDTDINDFLSWRIHRSYGRAISGEYR